MQTDSFPGPSGSWFERLNTWVLRCLTPPASSSGKVWWVYLACTLFITGSVIAIGPYHVTIHPEDTVHVLAQGDYLLRGLRPYVDYHSMHGPFPFLFFAAAIAVKGVSLEAVVLGQALGGLALGLLVFLAARNRLDGFFTIVLALSSQLVLVSFTAIGEKVWREFSCAMWYNAVGFVLYCAVFVHLLVPPRTRNLHWRWFEAVIMGVAMGAAFCTKVTFFAPLIVLFGIGEILLPRREGDRFKAFAALAVSGIFVVGLMASLGGSVEGYLELVDAMTIKVSPVLLLMRYLQFTQTIGLCLLALLIVALLARESGVLRKSAREFLLAIGMLGSVMLAASTASQDLESLPLLGVIPLGVGVAVAVRSSAIGKRVQSSLGLCCLASALLLIVHTPKNSVLSWIFSRASVPTLSERVHFGQESSLRGLAENVDPELFSMVPVEWSEHQLQGVSLVTEFRQSRQDRLFVASITTAIPTYTGQAIARGQAPWWPMVFSDRPTDVPLLREDLLEDTQLILEDLDDRRCWDYLWHHRSNYIESMFEPVAENEGWRLYRRAVVES